MEPGSVTPFGLINDTGRRVNVVLDAAMMAHELLNYHPLREQRDHHHPGRRSRRLHPLLRA